MNLIGKSYLAVKPFFKKNSAQARTYQQALTQRFLAEWESRQNLDDQPMLDDILDHTARNVPFYKNYFRNIRNKNPTLLSDWPILTRGLLRGEFPNLKSEQPPAGKSWSHASGGSTGKPVAVIHDEYFAAKAQALRNLCATIFFKGPHYNKLILWGMSEEIERVKCGSGSLKSRVKDNLLQMGGLKTSHINTFDFSREKFEKCVQILKYQKPEFIFGYAGSVYQLARYLHDKNIALPRNPLHIGTTAQTLYPFMREMIENVFGCDVCDHYGSREVGPIAWQHSNGNMYLPKFFSRVEVVNEKGYPCANGEQGRILVTTLHNFSMPLVRYEIGDLGIPGPDTTFEGYPFSTLASIVGKSNEEFIRRDGTLVHGQFFINLFYYRHWIDEFHIVQKQHELVQILYVLADKSFKPPPQDITEIDSRIRGVMTEKCEIQWREVDKIPTTRAGKRLYIRSELN